MRLTREQFVLFALVVVFFGLQFLPHHMTGLVNNEVSLLYLIVAVLLLVAIVVCFAITFFTYVLTRLPRLRLRRRNWFATFAMMPVVAVCMTAGSVAYSRGLPVGSFARRFDRQIWAKPSSSESVTGDITARQKMLGDVIRSVVRNNSRDAILKMLGPPAGDSSSTAFHPDLIYCTGPERNSFLAVDSEWLQIEFDSAGRMSQYTVWTD